MASLTKGTPTIADPPDEMLGPAMLECTEAERRFVMATVTIGGSPSRCALDAGYSGTPGAIAVTACRLMQNERVQAAIGEVGLKLFAAGRIPAIKFTLDVIEGRVTEAEVKDRLKAVEMLFNRTGMHATSEHKVAVTHKRVSDEEMVTRIEQLAGKLGLDATKLLGNCVVDADFEEVKADDLSDIF